MRTLRSNFETLKAWADQDPRAKDLLASVAQFEEHVAPIEAKLIQVQMKASEDNLRYPNQLNEQYDTFIATVDGDDVAPTTPEKEVFDKLHARLTEQLGAWQTLVATELPALNTRMQQAGVPRLAVGAGD
jgi:hypothetical protein